jgi:hypothetical protein
VNPTFLRASSAGVVKAMWIGAPQEADQQLAWAALTQNKRLRFENATSDQISGATGDDHPVIVVFVQSALAKYPKAKYIDERHFSVRAEYELDKNRGVILHCPSATALVACQYSAQTLFQRGFLDVKTIGMPSRRLTCPDSAALPDNLRPR